MQFDLTYHGEVLEQELYDLKEGGFYLVSNTEATYEPAIPLLRFPTVLDEPIDWTGDMIEGERRRSVKASIVPSAERLQLPSGEVDTVRVEVTLTIDGGGPEASNRRLRFWFAKGQGLVKREFEYSSTREPALEVPPAE